MHVARQSLGELIRLDVTAARLLRLARDDERCSRFVNQNGVHLVDDAEEVPLLPENEVVGVRAQVVAQVVEPELGVGHVGDVARVSHPALLVGVAALDEPNAQTEVAKHLSDPLAVSPCEVVVHRHDVHTLPRERIQVGWQDRDERLALACAHLRNLPLVQDHAAHELNVERPESENAHARLPGDGERLDEHIVERSSRRNARLEFVRLCTQRVVVERLNCRFELSHGCDALFVLLFGFPRGVSLQEVVEHVSSVSPEERARARSTPVSRRPPRHACLTHGPAREFVELSRVHGHGDAERRQRVSVLCEAKRDGAAERCGVWQGRAGGRSRDQPQKTSLWRTGSGREILPHPVISFFGVGWFCDFCPVHFVGM